MNSYLNKLENAFRASENTVDAASMKKYMKGQYEYYGIKSPKRREITREYLSAEGLPDDKNLKSMVAECWENPYRDFQYFAMEILFMRRKKLPGDFIDTFETMVVRKSWWDTVDYIAGKLIAFHFHKYPELKGPYITKWMDSGNIWLQRSCLLFQLHYKSDTDTGLLERLIMNLQGSREFFINKAIGWILREYSKTDAGWVVRFTENHPLAPLSHREALKWLKNSGKI
ncbi:MAG: DNA alkylation repair protein [Bacteroidales bacterium]|nr:DNA alkylation repair protein [Bacteroidales bacterium]